MAPRAALRLPRSALAVALLCLAREPAGGAVGAAPTAPPAAPAFPIIMTAPPATPEPAATHLFYLHGRIVQEHGRKAISAEYGPYLYDEIVARLAATGVTVISEARPGGTEPGAYAALVASQIRALVDAGVPATRITVVGASMGAWIALLVSHRLDLSGIGYVVMATCGEDSDRGFEGGLHGDVLSIYEASDPLGRSCASLFDRSAGIGRHAEIRLDTGLRHGFLYRPLAEWVEPAIAWARGSGDGRSPGGDRPAGRVLRVSPADSPAAIRERLEADSGITELILAAGRYPGGLVIPAPDDPSVPPEPLLMRPAEGAVVIFDGSDPLPRLRRLRGTAGVLYGNLGPPTVEPPALFDPDARVRYAEAADAAAVARFPATSVIDDGRLLLHPPEAKGRGGRPPLASHADHGIWIRRPRVTLRGVTLRHFLARAKWSAGVRIDADDVSVEGLSVENASIGVLVAADGAAVLGLTGHDLGCGVYVAGREARVEGCRLFKRRDGFEVPTYPQDDAAIQFYEPSRGGLVRDNLAAGFRTGLLMKTIAAPAWIERNTFVGPGFGVGFLSTVWDAGTVFRGNVVTGFERTLQTPRDADRRGIGGNCYAASSAPREAADEPGSIVGDPRFVDPAAGDYRLGPDSACLRTPSALAGVGAYARGDMATPATRVAAAGVWIAGAAAGRSEECTDETEDPERQSAGTGTPAGTPVATPEPTSRAGERAPRSWHVAVEGKDGVEGTEQAPVRTLQDAVDRAAPGDTILVGPGLYTDPVRFSRGGAPDRPITLRAARPGTVVIDGGRRHDVLIDLDRAPFVVLRDLEVRWYRTAGIRLRDTTDVVITGCRIWNAHWGGTWPTGNGIEATRSPRLRVEGNTLFAQERGLFLYLSPQAVVRHNTAVGNLYGAVQFVFSLEGSVCRDNSFAFQGNDAMVIVETPEGRDRLAGADIDHNNYGMTLREQPPGTPADRIAPRPIDRHLAVPSKALIYYEEQPGTWRRFESLAAWRAFSGKDAHSIVADPLFVKTAARDFRLEAKSPNRGAGTDAGHLGAAE